MSKSTSSEAEQTAATHDNHTRDGTGSLSGGSDPIHNTFPPPSASDLPLFKQDVVFGQFDPGLFDTHSLFSKD
jgi:hypothetical protein